MTADNVSPLRPDDEDFPPPRKKPKTLKVNPAKMVGLGNVRVALRVWSPDYGNGTVVALTGNGVNVFWDKTLAGTITNLLEHDMSYVERLERLDDEGAKL